MALNFKHVSEFSPDSKLFALINEQGILKIWDTETNELRQEYTPNLHLAGPCTSLTWVTIGRKKEKSKKERRSIENGTADTQYIALGTSRGGVAMYSFASGKIERNLKGEGHSAKVNNLSYDKKDFLYTCGDDSQIIVWSISEERQVENWSVGNEKPHSIVCIPESNSVLVGARQLQLYSVQTQELRQTFTGHTSDVIILKYFTHDSAEYVVSTSKMERVLCLWRISNKSKNKNPSCTFLMEDIAYGVSCKVDNEDNLQIAAVTRSGVVHFYVNPIDNIKPDKPIKPKVTIGVASDSDTVITPIPAIAASINSGPKAKDILIAYGDKQFLQFENVVPNFTEKLQSLIRNDPKLQTSKSLKKQGETNLKNVTPIYNKRDVEYRSSTTILKKKQNDIQIPMETRLQNLNLSNGEMPQAKSKVQLLVQALHSKDANLLWNVLAVNDTKVIHLTLQKLPVQYVGSLVNELTLLMEKKRMNVKIAATWLKILIKIHSSQLLAFGANDLLTKFGPCLGIVEHRSNCLKELSKLSGKLELLLNQIQRNTDEDGLNDENVLVYEDEDSSNSDIETNNMEQSSSDDQYEEDDSDEDMETN